MANVDLGWDVEGQLSVQDSVSAVLRVIESKGVEDSGTFWTWENKVCRSLLVDVIARKLTRWSHIRGERHTTVEKVSIMLFTVHWERAACTCG